MARPNLIISSLLASDTSDISGLLDTTALDGFTLDFATRIDALGTEGNPTALALDADPTSIRATEVVWGNRTNGAVLTGSGLNQIANIDQLEQSLQNGVASGAFDTLRLFSGGQNILSLNFATSALTLSSGSQSLALRGTLPTAFQDIFDFVTQLGNVASETNVAAAADVLRAFDLEGLRLVDGGQTLFDLTFDNNGLRIAAGGAQFRIDGTIPADNLGDIVDLLSDLNDLDQTAAGFNSLSQVPGLAITDVSLVAANGTRLIRSSGPIDEVSPLFANIIIEGTPGNDRNVFADDFGFDANNIVLQLGAGNDSAEFYGDRFGLEDGGGTPIRVNGGAGVDTVTINDFGSAQVVVDFFRQSLSGRELEDQFNYEIAIEGIEDVAVNAFNRVVVLGATANETATPGEVFGRFEFYGGDGTDTLNLTQVQRNSTSDTGLSRADLAGFSAIYGGSNTVEIVHEDLAATFILGDVERVRLRDGEVSLTEALAQSSDIVRFTLGTSGSDSISGDLGANVILGQSGADFLYGDGIQANLTGAAAGQVYRMYQATLDRAPDAGGYEGWVTSLYEGRVGLADFPNGFVRSPEFTQTYGALDDAGFVNLLYRNVLDRDADAGGLRGWLDFIADGGTRAGVVLGFSESAEFKQNTAQASADFALSQSEAHWTDEIYRVYRATLDRDPDLGGFTGWAELLGSGTAFETMIDGFVRSPEFNQTYGALDDTGFIELLYQNVLDRGADAGGLQGWLDFLDGGGTRAGVVRGFAQSAEFQRDTASDLTAWVKAQGRQDVQVVEGPQDKLIGGSGTARDVMMGGLMSDVFVFEGNQPARATIVDFEAWDVLQLNGYAEIGNFAQFRGALTQQGADTVFTSQDTEITFQNTAIADFFPDQVEIFAGF